jgi:hypothetical protein
LKKLKLNEVLYQELSEPARMEKHLSTSSDSKLPLVINKEKTLDVQIKNLIPRLPEGENNHMLSK